MNIEGKKVIIRAMEPSDMELLNKMVNDCSVESKVVGWSFPVSSVQQKIWYDTVINDQQNKRFMIDIRQTNKTIGLICLTDIDWKNRSAKTGIKLFPEEYRKKGYATDATMALLKFAFEELQLNRISMRILSNNSASLALYKKCGALYEGTLRKAIFKNGHYNDLQYYAILYEDYEKAKERLDL